MRDRGESNRLRIVSAADDLFYTHGYNQTSFSDIAEETGIPRGNFYYYFKTKEDILLAVLDQRLQQVNDMLQRCDKYSQDPKQRLLYFVEILIREETNVVKYGCPMGTLSSELAKTSGSLQQKAATVFATMSDWLESQLVQIGFADRAEEIALEILARLQGTTVIANVYRDHEFLRRSVKQHKHWLTTVLNGH